MKITTAQHILRTVTCVFLMLCLLASVGRVDIFASDGAEEEASQGEAASQEETAQPEYTQFSDLSGKRVSMLTGAPFEDLVLQFVPDVQEFTYFNNTPDMLLALKAGKTDAALMNGATATLAIHRDTGITIFPQVLKEEIFGFAFQKGDPDRDAWQEARDHLPEETVRDVWEKWSGSDESVKTMPAQDWPGTNGTITVAACDTLEPMSYAGEGGAIRGFDAEMILLMAKELDVHVNFVGMEFSSILSYIQSGKAEIGIGSIFVTDERKEAVDFVEYFPSAFVLVVRTAGAQIVDADEDASSFEKTFIREDRWKLFLSGIGTTLLISFLSILFGTALGFLLFLACRHGNRIANGIARVFGWLMAGMPVVVLLMILYYIVFGNVSISGVVVSVIGFTLVFGAEVYAMIKTAVGAVDGGQMEAAYALGYTDRRAFFRHILPQAMPHFMPGYRGGMVSLVKATSVVGYIAVQDLTKMGDIVRSRTYEAFFPLIAVAIIYYILAGILVALMDRLTLRFNPMRRKKEDILKGIENHD